MNLNKIEEMWEKDSQLHRELPELLANDSLETAKLHSKYLKWLNQFRLMLSEAERDIKVLRLEKWQYYSGKKTDEDGRAFPYKVMKGDLSVYMDGDDELCRATAKIHYLETCINCCERILKQIDSRGFSIKNAFDIIKYYDIR